VNFGVITFSKFFVDYIVYKVRYYFFRHGRYPFF
jgi:hypothetical protein